ncbi:putative sodium channel protein type 4 subunit alpha B-like [Apostichopus japonicus]|uniref:Putative sodium channel protein type 4 subunit alpha B-like n=1 Tax=Stichopus japonicus TaxID=307972 RepID=A0A2G8JNA3_STIJA|nr:putative sodium channel protein type 4 subunit alpha B-like [Apostichopus japonicus]
MHNWCGVPMSKNMNEARASITKMSRQELKLNLDKCKFKVDEVPYIGHILTSDGVKPDIKKVKAIRDMHPPTNITELKRFLGMVNYVAKFVDNLSAKTFESTSS